MERGKKLELASLVENRASGSLRLGILPRKARPTPSEYKPPAPFYFAQIRQNRNRTGTHTLTAPWQRDYERKFTQIAGTFILVTLAG